MEMEISSFKVSEALRRPECFLLSDGGQAYVYLTVMDIGNKKQCQVVIKLFKLEFSSEYETELQAMRVIEHTNIIRLLAFASRDTLIYPAMMKGNLAQVTHKPSCTGLERLNFLKELFTALVYIHGLEMAHGDIKPENIVLDDDGHIRLIDFALCRVVNDHKEEKEPEDGVGTWPFSPPEARMTKAGDVYSAGVTGVVLLFGFEPYKFLEWKLESSSQEGVDNTIKNLLSLPSMAGIHRRILEKVLDFLDRCTDNNPKKRPSAKDGETLFKLIANETSEENTHEK